MVTSIKLPNWETHQLQLAWLGQPVPESLVRVFHAGDAFRPLIHSGWLVFLQQIVDCVDLEARACDDFLCR